MKLFFVILSLSAPVVWAQGGGLTTILNEERALPIVVVDGASAETLEAAHMLANGLKRISGREFSVSKEFSSGAIRIGTDAEIPQVLPAGDTTLVASQKRDDYLLQSNGKDVLLVARTGGGLTSAVWDFLYRLGHRQFFPGEKWEIWPSLSEISVALDEFESPDFYNRTLAPAGMNWPAAVAALNDWKVKNRMVSQFQLNTTHVYEAIIKEFPEHFLAYPEDLVPNEMPEAVKLDPSRTSVLKVAAEFAIARKTKDPNLDSISMDPSDGGGWRTDSPLGSPSNQAITLANYVAQALQGPFPGTKVGVLAYHEHSPPPNIPIDRNVIVSVAAGFIKGGYTFEDLLEQWGKSGNETGVYEYLSVNLWDYCHPGKSRASDLGYLSRTIPQVHALGARYYRSEIDNSWAPHGLGYYLVSRMLWDRSEASNLDTLLDDFYRRSFGVAAPKMEHYFKRYLLAEGAPLLSRDLVGRMYRTLAEALAMEVTKEERARILDFVEYTRFLELSIDCYEASDGAFPDRYRLLCEFLWRTQASLMVNGGSYFWRSNHPIHSASTIFGRRAERPAKWTDPKHPWKTGEPIKAEELQDILAEGIKRNTVLDIEPVAYSSALVALPESGETRAAFTERITLWRENRFYVEMPEEQGRVYLSVRAISRAHGPVKLRLYSKDHALVDEPVWSAEIPADGKEHHLIIQSPYRGVHEVLYSDGNGKAVLTWPKGQRITFPVGSTENSTIANRADLAFYVPRGVEKVGLFVENPTGKIVSANGDTFMDLSTMGSPGYVSIPVPSSEAGTVLIMQASLGRRILLNVPPYVSRHPSELLVPKEVLEGR